MFEQYTYENILQEMIEETSPEFDVSETSPLYASYAVSAAQIAKFYRHLERVRELGFASTSEGEYLEKRTSEMGVFFNPAVAAIRRGEFNTSVPVGSRFYVQDLYFVVIRNDGSVQLQCEETGIIGNSVPAGTEMLPLETIEGLETAKLGEVIVPGSEQQSDESLFVKYQEKVAEPATSGNKAHYIEWTREMEGVGAVRVFPNWDGPDTVKLVVVDTEYLPASSELVDLVQEQIDPLEFQGQGEGLAPVGAFVTVESAIPVELDIDATIEMSSSTTLEAVTSEFKKLFTEHLKAISFKEEVEPIIRQRVVGSLLLSINGVVDYTDLLINANANNIRLDENEAPVVGQVTLNGQRK